MRWNNGKVLRVTQLVFIKLTIPLTSLNVFSDSIYRLAALKISIKEKAPSFWAFSMRECHTVFHKWVWYFLTWDVWLIRCRWSFVLVSRPVPGNTCRNSVCTISGSPSSLPIIPPFLFPFLLPSPPSFPLSLSLLMPCLGILLWYQLVEVLHLFTKKTFSETLDSTMSHKVGGKVTIRLDIKPLIPDLFDSPVFILPIVPGNID